MTVSVNLLDSFATDVLEDDTASVTLNNQASENEQIAIDINQIINGLDTLLDTLQNTVENQAFSNNLPLVGNSLKDSTDSAAQFLENLRTPIKNALQQVTESTPENIAQALANALGLPSDAITVDTSNPSDIKFSVPISNQATLSSMSLANNLGLPGIGLTLNGDANVGIDYAFDLKFGYHETNGFYFDTSSTEDNPELTITLDTSISNFSGVGNLGFMQVEVADDVTNPSQFTGTFTVDLHDSDNQLQLTELHAISQSENYASLANTTLDGNADINLNLTTSFNGSTESPSLKSDLNVDWVFEDANADPNQPQLFGNVPTVAFNNVELCLGSFFSDIVSPALSNIQKILEPFQFVIDKLNQPLDLKVTEFTILDLLQPFSDNFNDEDQDFIDSLVQLSEIINNIPTDSELCIPLQGFDFGNQDIRLPDFDPNNIILPEIPDFSPELPESSSEANFYASIQTIPGGGLYFPILEDPTQAYNLLLGKTAEFVTYDMPNFGFGAGYEQFFSIFGPLGATIKGDFAAAIDLAFGYDSLGLEQFAKGADNQIGTDDDFSGNLDTFQGFYINDFDDNDLEKSELNLNANLLAYAGGTIPGLASFGAGGGITGLINFDLNDPNADGKVRYEEFANLLANPEDLFTTSGELKVGLSAYFQIGVDLGIFGDYSYTKNFNGPEYILLSYNQQETGKPTEPHLINRYFSDSTPVDWLNMGSKAVDRKVGDMIDGAEVFTVVHHAGAANSETILVSAFGVTQDQHSVYKLAANGGEENDIIDLQNSVLTAAELAGGNGDDLLIGGRGNDSLQGDSGWDRLYGKDGDDSLSGGADVDWLIGGVGADTLDGGEGFDIAAYYDTSTTGIAINLITGEQTGDAAGDVFLSIEQIDATPYDDTLTGNAEDNNFSGFEGNDFLSGNSGVDILKGDAGDDYLEGGAGNDILFGNADNDTLFGNEGDDFIDAADGNDSINGGAGNDTLLTGWGEDIVDGGEGTDLLVIDYSTLPTAAYIWSQDTENNSGIGVFVGNAYGMSIPHTNINSNGGYISQNASISADGMTVAWNGKIQDLEQTSQPIWTGTGYNLSFSTDGSKIAFEAGLNIYISNADSTNLIEIVDREEEKRQVAELLGLDPSQLTAISSPQGVSNPIISGDGTKVAWQASWYDTTSSNYISYIGISNIDGTEVVRSPFVYNNSYLARDPFLSADSSKITWIEPTGSNGSAVFVANSDFTNIQQVSVISTDSYNNDQVAYPQLSADGSLIAWAQQGYDENGSFSKVFVAQTNNLNLDPVEITEGLSSIYFFPISLSSDGDQIAFVKPDGNGNYNIFVANTDGTGKPILITSGNFYDITTYHQALSAYVDQGVSYGSFDLTTGSGEIITWGPSHITFSNIEKFDITGTIYGDELFGGDLDDILKGNGGADVLKAGLGDDTYELNPTTAAGSQIQDTGGNDTLNLTGITLSLAQSVTGTLGLQRENTTLLIDLNQDGMIHPDDDLSILDFFAGTSGTQAGTGFLETINNLSGTDILTTLSHEGNDLIEGRDSDDELNGGTGDDTLNGGAGNDTLNGGAGNDTLLLDWGEDSVNGGEGTDLLVIDYSTLPTGAILWRGKYPETSNYKSIVGNAYGMNTPKLYFSSYENSAAALSPDGTKVAWVRNVQDLETSEPISVNGSDISFSTDGSKIAYTPFGSSGIEVSNADGTNPIKVVDGEQEKQQVAQLLGIDSSQLSFYRSFDNPVISGNGDKVAWQVVWRYYSSQGSAYVSYVGISNSDGTGVVRSPLLSSKSSSDTTSYPSLSADGSKIAWIQTNPDTRDDDILFANSDFTNIQIIDSVDGDASNTMLSADGSVVAWYDDDVSQVFVAPTDGTGQPIGISGHTGYRSEFSLSPDGDRIAFIKGIPTINGGINYYENVLFVANTDGTGEPIAIASGDNSNRIKTYSQALSAYVDIGVRYGSFDLTTGSGEIITWGPSHITFSNVERFDITGTLYGDELLGGNFDDILTGNGGADILKAGLGDDTYQLDTATAAGSQIQDTGGVDTLNFFNTTLLLSNLLRQETSLIIDLNQDGVASLTNDLAILNFFNADGTAGDGLIETVDNLSGGDILNSLGVISQL